MAKEKCLCEELANILKGEAEQKKNLCKVTRERKNLKPTILGHPTSSDLVIALEFSFEPVAKKDKTLNLAELVFLQEEVNPFLEEIKKSKQILVTAIHNHWLFEEPRLIYVHLESVQNPIEFAKEVADALKKAGVSTHI
ncbi:DUF1259 domain-containing protein [Priestia megaterium]|uniref:DUF1259 domain-containing protein n=1 Tax=Priestia megaterium TaxID=1404 RepID=UPI002860FACD|nr:DUF1259 domain-containing protein [Priestia megaterium]MDR7247101.1 3-methyladenine DNA glycosylase AlkC [Priestia megaterium]